MLQKKLRDLDHTLYEDVSYKNKDKRAIIKIIKL